MFRANLEQNLALKMILSSIFAHVFKRYVSINFGNVLHFENCDDLSGEQPQYCSNDLSRAIIYLPITIGPDFDTVNTGRRRLRFAHGDIIAKKSNIA